MTMHARFLPKYPKRINVTDGLTKREINGILTLGFDYENSEFGAELKQAVDAASADAAAAIAAKTAAQTAQTAAETAADEAESWAGIAETGVVNIDTSFDLLADAEAATIGASKKAILTQGYSVIGKGGARYLRVATEPTHAGKLRSTDRFLPDGTTDATNGGWWVIAEPIIDARMLGLTVGSNADAELTDAIEVASALVAPLRLPHGSCDFLKNIDFSPLLDGAAQIIVEGDFTANFTSAIDVGEFPGGGFVYMNGGALIALPNLASNADEGVASLTFVSTPSLISGDRICIFNPTEGSYSAARTYYFAGEFCKVSDGSGGTAVKLYGTTFAAYAYSAVSIYKHPNKKIVVTGGTITIIESRATGFGGTAGFKADRIVDSDLSAFRPTQSLYAGMAFKQCVGIYGTGYQCKMVYVAGADNAYGLIYGNSQDIRISGEFDGGRHGVAGGGYGDTGSVPSRNVHISGTFRNSPDALSSLGAVNFHGNCEYCSYTGTIEGGITFAGNYNEVNGNVSARPSQAGLAVYFGEMIGTAFKLSGRVKVPSGATVGTPVISIGDLGSSPLNIDTVKGGVLDFSNVVFDCPYNSRLITIQNHAANPTEPIILDVRGAKWLRSATTPTHAIIVNAIGSRGIEYALMDGFVNGPNAPYSMAGAAKVRGWRLTDEVTLSPSTGASVVTATKTINAPKKPKVALANPPVTMGGARAYAYVDSSTTATSAVIGMATCDGNSFPSSAGGTLGFIASLDE